MALVLMPIAYSQGPRGLLKLVLPGRESGGAGERGGTRRRGGSRALTRSLRALLQSRERRRASTGSAATGRWQPQGTSKQAEPPRGQSRVQTAHCFLCFL